MKLKFPPRFIPYGPVGHPQARCFTQFIDTDKDELHGRFYSFLEKYKSQSSVPTTFFRDELSLEENGYHLVPFERDEVSDDILAALPKAYMYAPPASGEPGRQLDDIVSFLPSYFRRDQLEVWVEGAPGCNHDFGLETYEVIFREDWTENRFPMKDVEEPDFDKEGTYFGTIKCTRCGAWHAMPESRA